MRQVMVEISIYEKDDRALTPNGMVTVLQDQDPKKRLVSVLLDDLEGMGGDGDLEQNMDSTWLILKEEI